MKALLSLFTFVCLTATAFSAAPASPRAARASEFQFTASVPFTDSKGAAKTTTAYLWIPESCQRVRGVLLTQQNVAEQPLVEHPSIRQACRDSNLAIVWFYPSFAPTFEHPDPDGAVLQNALNDLAATSGYNEIATTPWLSFGHSTTGNFAQRLANWKPERCIAQVVMKSGVDFTLPNNRQVPLLEVGGMYTEWNQPDRRDWTPNEAPFGFWAVSSLRKERAATQRPMSYLLQYGSGHFELSESEAELITMYLRKAAAVRLPAGENGALRPVEIDNGWVVGLDMLNSKRIPATPVKTAPLEARNEAWFFDEEMAKAVEKAMSVNWKRKTQVPVLANADGSLPGFDTRGLLQWNRPEPGDDGATVRVKPAFLETVPANFKIGPGAPLGHSGTDRFELGWISGGGEITGPYTIRFVMDRRRTLYGGMISVRHPGNDEYRPSIQPVDVGIISNKKGSPQKITFDPIPDQPATIQQLELRAASDAGLPVEYCVIAGPARVSGNVLTFTGIPPRSRFPITVTVLAYQFGRSAVQSAVWVERNFQLLPK